MLGAYAAALPGARAAVLSRLWRGLVHDPLPWVTGRRRTADEVVLRLADGRLLAGPDPDPWATAGGPTAVTLDGAEHHHPAALTATLRVPGGPGFAAELDHSAASLALSRAAPVRAAGPTALWEWEQRVADGHPYHPGCRSRPGFTAAEQLAYAPGHGPVVRLPLAAVDGCTVVGTWPDGLHDGRTPLLPVHPWQAEHVLPRLSVPHRLAAGCVTARPLMSLRTVEPLESALADVHLKTALSSRLTSSVRDISPYSLERAVDLSEFLAGLCHRLDDRLRITRTLAAAGAHPDLAALWRESPAVHADAGEGEQVVPVAALATAWPDSGPPERRLARVTELARLALPVCLRMLDLGVALEAHGQNLLAVLGPDGGVRRLVYRDLADIRTSPARLARHGVPAPPLAGRLIEDDPAGLRRKLFCSLVTGALGPLAGGAPALGRVLRDALTDLPPTADTAALRQEPLPAKALTLMRLETGRSGDLWTELPNPLAPRWPSRAGGRPEPGGLANGVRGPERAEPAARG
ncbi:IucA/IucC family protein [Streptomyces sp. B1866]|uniref:IucA/IucC family protein n=1 Tax=Streptomyces sp. B1866 TaxID=3075431 RepID=UPI00288E8C5C|nr:IucA/IucC family protein [Streptomyces sp. B1866]MDT3397943.1 IucA/IucC family protein [Streptomyces sp. B1866]